MSGWVWQLLTGTNCQFYRLEGTCSAIPEARFPYYSSFASTDGYGYLTADVMYNLCVSPCKVYSRGEYKLLAYSNFPVLSTFLSAEVLTVCLFCVHNGLCVFILETE